MSFVKTILAQLRGDNGECGARVRKNKTRNAQVGNPKIQTRKQEETLEELKPVTRKRTRKPSTGEVVEVE